MAFYIMMIVLHHNQKPELMGKKNISKPSSVNSGTVWPISVLICMAFSKQHEKKLLIQLDDGMIIYKHPV